MATTADDAPPSAEVGNGAVKILCDNRLPHSYGNPPEQMSDLEWKAPPPTIRPAITRQAVPEADATEE
jgi:hypothetical protein